MKLSIAEQEARTTLLEMISAINLPKDYPWKVLGYMTTDLCQFLTDNEVKTISRIIRARDFTAYLQLSEDWGIQSTYLSGRPIAEVRAVYQLISLLKKFRFPGDRVSRVNKAKEKLVLAEKACKAFNTSGYKELNRLEDKRMRGVFTHAKSFMRKLLGVNLPDSDKLTEWSRHGPGANLDTIDGLTNTFSKYENWPYSCTKAAIPYARFAIESDPRWLGALEDSYRDAYMIPKHVELDWRTFWQQVFWIVPGNRITFVPKNAVTERSIAIEPSMLLYLQLGVDGFIRRQLLRWGVDIDDQEKNKELARLGSLLERFSTLDLASASDSISLAVVKYLCPKEWYDFLIALRSPEGEYKGETIVYEKISSMGNGYTFALETAIFTSIVYGVQMEFNGCYESQDCAIYGDDLIVTTELAQPVTTALAMCGFRLNTEKSFTKGPFRESCGADWFQGKQIRPVFFNVQPTELSGLYTDINRLKRILELRWGITESKTVTQMMKWIPIHFQGLVGPYSDEEFGTYLHHDAPIHGYKHWLYAFPRLIVKSVSLRFPRDAFLFGKLMDNLRPGHVGRDVFGFTFTETPIGKFEIKHVRNMKLTAQGSKFSLTDNRSVRVSIKRSVTSNWSSEYTEHVPAWGG